MYSAGHRPRAIGNVRGNVLTALAMPSSKTLTQTKPPSGLWPLASGLWLLASGFSLTLLGLLKHSMQGIEGVVCQLPGEQGR